jgi:hypothetical protein
MKAVLFFIATAITSLCNAQSTKLTPKQQEYLQKSNNQRTAAFVCVIGGAALIGVGVAKLSTIDNTGETLLYTGLGLEAVSIPLFIVSGKNKRRAALAIKNNYGLFYHSQGITVKRIPALSFTITL